MFVNLPTHQLTPQNDDNYDWIETNHLRVCTRSS